MIGRLLKFQVIVWCLVYVSTVLQGLSHANDEQKSILRNAVKELLEFDRLPVLGERIRSLSIKTNPAADYMRNLFDKYTHQKHFEASDGMIIRSILPLKKYAKNESSLSFNLKVIKIDEQIVMAELHYYARYRGHLPKSKLNKLITVASTCKLINDCRDLHKNQLELMKVSNADNWIIFDATQLIREYRMRNLESIHLQFTRRTRKLRARDVLRKNTPFLLVHTYLTPNMRNAKLRSFAEASNKSKIVSRRKRETDYYSYSKNGRYMSPEAKIHMHMEKIRNIGPKVLQSRKQIRKSQQRHHKKYDLDPMKGFGKDISREKQMRKDGDVSVVLLKGEQQFAEKCTKRNLKVNFKEIGWEDWIIAPTSFEAHYCSGTCPFPLDKAVNPSNHAIVQSIIHAIGLNTLVPPVCCAPDKMDSLTLLYYDEMENIVLKNYPKMIVSSCSCI